MSLWCLTLPLRKKLSFMLQVLLDQRELTGEEIDFILDNYPPQMPTSLVLEERDPGSLPFFEEKKEAESKELEYTMLSS